MARQRRGSSVSNVTSHGERDDQELSSMYDYLAKVILLGPSGCGKSCLLHRIVKNEWQVLSSQTIGVEFASKIVKVGNGAKRKRMKLQLWDTAGTERFRSVSRSYYRGAAGAILVYDLASRSSFDSLPTFLNDARALASPNLTLLLAGNKLDLSEVTTPQNATFHTPPLSASGILERNDDDRLSSSHSSVRYGLGSRQTATIASEGREISHEEASRWASKSSIPVAVELSALTGAGVEEIFTRLASMILTKIELGEINPDDPMSGIQYGDNMTWDDGGSFRNTGGTVDNDNNTLRRRRKGKGSLNEWSSVFKLDKTGPRRTNSAARCC